MRHVQALLDALHELVDELESATSVLRSNARALLNPHDVVLTLGYSPLVVSALKVRALARRSAPSPSTSVPQPFTLVIRFRASTRFPPRLAPRRRST